MNPQTSLKMYLSSASRERFQICFSRCLIQSTWASKGSLSDLIMAVDPDWSSDRAAVEGVGGRAKNFHPFHPLCFFQVRDSPPT